MCPLDIMSCSENNSISRRECQSNGEARTTTGSGTACKRTYIYVYNFFFLRLFCYAINMCIEYNISKFFLFIFFLFAYISRYF